MTGMIQGGWEFVWSAYGITFVVLAGYVFHVVTDYLRERRAGSGAPPDTR